MGLGGDGRGPVERASLARPWRTEKPRVARRVTVCALCRERPPVHTTERSQSTHLSHRQLC